MATPIARRSRESGNGREKTAFFAGGRLAVSEDRDSVILFNGEIYNHLEVRHELESLGRRFQTHCDKETVLQAFLEWDTNCFERLRGMFAVAIRTNSKERLVLARDGIRMPSRITKR
jgi:asparagine synthase (glutamine-hydrolysing)